MSNSVRLYISFAISLIVMASSPLGADRKLIAVTPGVTSLEGTVTLDLDEGGGYLPCAMQLGDGTLVVQFSAADHRWIRGRAVIRSTQLLTFSKDAGRTWAQPRRIPYTDEIEGAGWWASFGAGDTFYGFARPIQNPEGKPLRKGLYMLSGRIIGTEIVWNPEVLVHSPPAELHGGIGVARARDGTFLCLYAVRAGSGQEIHLRRSTDLGQHWSEEILVDPDGGDYKEILSLPGGKLVAMWTGGMRPGQEYPNMREGTQFRISEDGGKTWGPRHTVEPFSPPFYAAGSASWTSEMILRLGPGPKMVQATTTPDGAILALGRWSSYGDQTSPMVARVIAAKSYDGGFTWTEHTVLHEITGDIANRMNILGSRKGFRTSTESGHMHTYGSSSMLADGVLIAYTAPDYDGDRKRAHLVKLPAYPGVSWTLAGAKWSYRDLGLFPYELLSKFVPLGSDTAWSPVGLGAADGSQATQYLLRSDYVGEVKMTHPWVRCHLLTYHGQTVAVLWSDEGRGTLQLDDLSGVSVRDVDNRPAVLSGSKLQLGLRPVFLFSHEKAERLAKPLAKGIVSDLPAPESEAELKVRRAMLARFNLANQSFVFFEDDGRIPRRGSSIKSPVAAAVSSGGQALSLNGSQALNLKAPADSQEGPGLLSLTSPDPTGFHTSPLIYNMQAFTAAIWLKSDGGKGERVAVSQQSQFEIGIGPDNKPYGFLNLISQKEFQIGLWTDLDFGPGHAPVQRQLRHRLQEGDARLLGKAYRVVAGQTLAPDAWTHVALTYDGVDLRIFVDGTLSGTMTIKDSLIPRFLTQGRPPDLWIGRSASAAKNFWTGSLQDLRFFGTPLDAAQINQLIAISKP